MAKRISDSNVWVRTFEVTDPTRHCKGFTVYKVVSTVFPKSFPESATKITVWKRYSEFRKLHKELELIFKQLYLKGEFPDFPKAKVFGRFEHEVVEERRKAALTLLTFTANYTQLFTSKAFMVFFENGYLAKDFVGQILFSRSDVPEEPPTTVVSETSDIPTPCLEPERTWSSKVLGEDDCLSPSPSSVSSSLSPETPEISSLTDAKYNSVAAPDTNHHTNFTKNCDSQTQVPAVANKSNSTTNALYNTEKVSSQPQSQMNISASKGMTSHPGNGIVRSATVTDDLASYFDEEFEDAAFLFPSGSCSSLDALPGCSEPAEPEVEERKPVVGTSRGLFSLPRRKPNGFGLFDFLPLFPKKSKKKSQESEESGTTKLSNLSVGYICEAAGHFAVAQFHESNTDYQDAFTAYKEGIRVLLAGAQDDADHDRKLLAKNKLEKYLSRAESLKESYLSPGGCSNSGAISPVFSSPNRKNKCLSALDISNKSTSMPREAFMSSDLTELKDYKVVGVGPDKCKVLVVMNPLEESPKCYAVKVLWKSPCIIYPEKPNLIPSRVPFMVNLEKWFNTPDKIILLLEHAGGGRLVDFVKNYQGRSYSPLSPNPEASEKEMVHPQPENEENCILTGGSMNSSDEASSRSRFADFGHASDIIVAQTDAAQCSELIISESFIDPELKGERAEDRASPTDGLVETQSLNHESLEVNQLVENSKALLETVTKTLEKGHTSASFQSPAIRNEHENLPTAGLESTSVKCSHSTKTDGRQETIHDSEAAAIKSEENVPQKTDYSDTDENGEFENVARLVPEGCIKVWAAEIVLALEALHSSGITYGDLHNRNILLGENGHILLSYKSLWTPVDDPISWNAYMAPEVRDLIGIPLWKIHPSADWWSLGAVLFLLFTGQTFHSAHPEGIFPEMVVKVPACGVNGICISKSAQTLLRELLQYVPTIRLGYYGAAEIKSHPFFEGFDWDKAAEDSTSVAAS